MYLPILFCKFASPKYSSICQVYNECRFFNVNQSLSSPNSIWISIIMKVIWFTLKQSEWLESKPKSENYSWRLSKSQSLVTDWKFYKYPALLFSFRFLFYALVLTLTPVVIMIATGCIWCIIMMHIFRRIINLFRI